VSINNHIWTSKPIHHIWPTDVSFPVFHCSTKNNSPMINPSSLFIQLRFLHSSNRPFPSCLLPLCQNESKYKTIHMTFTYRFFNSFLCERFRTKTRFETEVKGNIYPWAAHRSLWLTIRKQQTLNFSYHESSRCQFS